MSASSLIHLKKSLCALRPLALMVSFLLLLILRGEAAGIFSDGPFPRITAALNGAQTQLVITTSGEAGAVLNDCADVQDPGTLGGTIVLDPYVLQSSGQLTIRQSSTILATDTVAFTQMDAGSGVDGCPAPPNGVRGTFSGTRTIDVSTYPNGTYSVSVRACANSTATSCRTATATFNITARTTETSVPPTAWVTLSPNPGTSWTAQTVTATINCKRSDNGACVNYRYKIIPATHTGTNCETAPGTFVNGNTVPLTSHVKICGGGRNGPASGQGLQGLSDIVEVKIDQIAPQCGTFSPNPVTNWSRTSQSFTMSGQSDSGESGLAAAFSNPLNCTASVHGTTCSILIRDTAGNSTSCPSPAAKIDMLAPTVQASPEPPRSVVSPTTIAVTLTAIDPIDGTSGASGVAMARYSVDGTASAQSGTAFTTTASTTLSGVGTHSISYWIRDNVGNEASGVFSPYTITLASATCGNGTVEAGANEQCDDGNSLNGDSCTSTCQWTPRTFTCAAKPSGTIWNTVASYVQQCLTSNGVSCTSWAPSDDPITNYSTAVSDSSCQFTCTSGQGWDGNACVPISGASCGNAVIDSGEQCDDGNTVGGDGCTSTCRSETRTFTCAAKPSGTIWNTVGSYLQTCTAWSGSTCTNWSPSDDSVSEYNTTAATNACRYICASGFIWNGSACVAGSASGNNAEFVSQTLPSGTLIAGQTYPVTVTMRNIGTTTWTKALSYKLGSQSPQDNTTWGIGRVLLTDTEQIVPPTGTKTFTFSITAPTIPGTYAFQWRMLREGVEWFGEFSTLNQFTVVAPSWSGNVHNSAYGQDMGWVLFGDPNGTSFAGLYSGVTIATEPQADGSYPVSGAAYSPLLGLLNFDATKVVQIGNWGVMTGNALFSSSGGTLSLSAGTVPCETYRILTSTPDSANYGVCIDPQTGYLFGYAWSAQYGWLKFAANTAQSLIGAAPVRDQSAIESGATYQVVSGWRALTGNVLVTAQSTVLRAQESITVPLVAMEAGQTLNCNLLNGLIIHKLFPGTVYASFRAATNRTTFLERTFANNGLDYSFQCADGTANLILKGDIARMPGLYWVSGNVLGTELENSATGIPGVQAGDPVTYQIVAGQPCWANCAAAASKVEVTKAVAQAGNTHPVADGVDSYTFDVSLSDAFGNAVNFVEPLWFDPTKKAENRDFAVTFDDRISLVQILGESGGATKGNATRYQPLLNTEAGIETTFGTMLKTLHSAENSTNQMRFKLMALAPTSFVAGSLTEDNRLQIKDLKYESSAPSGLTLSFLSPLTQQMSNSSLSAADRPQLNSSSAVATSDGNSFLTFLPLFTARPTFPSESYAEGRPAFFSVDLAKKGSVAVSNPYLLQELGTQSASGQIHSPRRMSFSDFHDTDFKAASLFSNPINFFEVAKSGNASTPTQFSALRTGMIHAILASLFSGNTTLQMSFVPTVTGAWQSTDRLLYRAFAAYSIAGEIVKYEIANKDPNFCAPAPLNAPGCVLPPESCNGLSIEACCAAGNVEFCQEDPGVGALGFSVIGPTHGQGVVATQISNLEGVSFESGSFSYSKLQEILRRNIAELTRGQNAAVAPQNPLESIAPDGFDDDRIEIRDTRLHFANIDALFTPGSSAATNENGIGRLLKDNQVLWVTANSSATKDKGFTLVIDGDSVLSGTTGPRTLIVEGGNVYLKGNITGSGQLAILLLKNRATDPSESIFTRYANLLIAPKVTNIKAAVYAEGSLLTMDDGDRDGDGIAEDTPLGIYDGFDDQTAWSEVLKNQLYLFGIFATRNTAGGTSSVEEGGSGTEGIPNDAGLFFPPLQSFSTYPNASEEDRMRIARRFDVKAMRNFSRALVLANDQNSDGVIDTLENDPTVDCEIVNCVPDASGPKQWVVSGEGANEALRFDGREWLEVLPYQTDGTCGNCSALEASKFVSAVIFEYDRALQEHTPIGFNIPAEISSGARTR